MYNFCDERCRNGIFVAGVVMIEVLYLFEVKEKEKKLWLWKLMIDDAIYLAREDSLQRYLILSYALDNSNFNSTCLTTHAAVDPKTKASNLMHAVQHTLQL